MVFAWGTNPLNRDTDWDGLSDSDEITKYDTNPIKADSDSDELPDGHEIELGTDPRRRDSDGDLIPDGEEVEKNWDPLDPESPGNTENPSKDASNEYVLSILLLGLLAVIQRVKRNQKP
jgi:hypothetical protein